MEWVYEFHRRQIDPIVPGDKETLRVQLKALVENERRLLSVRREPAWRLVREFDLYETVWSSSQLLTRRNGPLDLEGP